MHGGFEWCEGVESVGEVWVLGAEEGGDLGPAWGGEVVEESGVEECADVDLAGFDKIQAAVSAGESVDFDVVLECFLEFFAVGVLARAMMLFEGDELGVCGVSRS